MKTIIHIPASFPFQSYLDSGLKQAAILSQSLNDPIVTSTKKTIGGFGVRQIGLTGASQTPVAVRVSGGKGETGTFILRPGQHVEVGQIDSIDYGLPFGWLGGGISTIVLGPEGANLDLGSSARPEIIFHRFRTGIVASANPLPALVQNWPLQFPWTHAANGNSDQSGAPVLRVEPTRALLRLRSQIAVDKVVGVVFRGSREFDESSAGAVGVADLNSTFVEIAFRASTDPSLALYPTASIPDDFLRLACDEGGLTLLDLGDAALTNVEVDIVRFGRI